MHLPIRTLLAALLFATACSRHVSTRSINIISQEAQGLAVIEADGLGNTQLAAEQDAQNFVLDRVLYTGVPDAQSGALRLPMIENRNALNPAAQKQLGKLLESANAARYFTAVSQRPAGPALTSANQFARRFTFKLNYDLLRRDLEQHQIIRKFGL